MCKKERHRAIWSACGAQYGWYDSVELTVAGRELAVSLARGRSTEVRPISPARAAVEFTPALLCARLGPVFMSRALSNG